MSPASARSTSSNRRGGDDEAVAFLNPDTAVQGLAGNFEGTVVDARWESWDFKGKAKPKPDGKSGVVMALHVTIDDRDDGGKAHEEYYPAGPIEDFVPSDDGQSFEAITGKKGFFRDREVIQFSQAVLDTGAVKASDLGTDPSVFVGGRFFWERKPPTWAKDGKDASGKQTNASVLVPTSLVEAAGNSRGGKARPAAAASSAAPRSRAAVEEPEEQEQSDEALYDAVEPLVREVLDDLPAKQDTISREELGTEVFALMNGKHKKSFASAADRKAANALFDDDAFLKARAGRKTWRYDVKAGEVERV